MTTRAFGWKRSKPDHRDYKFACRPRVLRNLPDAVQILTLPPVFDQGQLGSCTANAVNLVFEYAQMQETPETHFTSSRLFTYYNERVLEGTVDYDSGAEMRDAIKAVVKYGVCPEADWPYDIDRFTEKPPAPLYDFALKNQGLVYSAVEQSLCQMQGVLATGFPFILGFTVYESFEEIGPDGIMPMPGPNEGVLGGHAVVACGYDNATRRFTIRNSWGKGWGHEGNFYMPYEFMVSDNVADCWVLQSVEE